MFKKIYEEKNKIIIALTLIVIGVVGRLSFYQILPDTPSIYITLNGVTQPMFMMDLFFLIAAIALISGLLLGSYYTFVVPISVMIITDLILGNTWILLFVWSGFALIGLIGYMLNIRGKLTLKRVPNILGAGIGGVLIYDLWTNFGCWVGWYPHTINGLSMCFTVAIPFILWHLLSTTFILTIILIPIIYLKEKKILETDKVIRPIEKRIALITPAVLMVLAIISLTM